ncbi:Gx transporter family protein [uncultured Treponema sp.]|uniref:Gx transporter family protein n=1 Tax=uncultured Treponema sp. TaxID=162155 RepID=UPI0025950512|nr:Gx transporter family protein [uncultured Treponema sp.]
MEKIDWNKIAFFSALCFFLSALEYAVPKPLPFFKIGFANLPILISLSVLKKKETMLLVFLKIFLQAVISGTLFSYVFVFSFAGSVASGLFMMLAYFIFRSKISFIGISVCGGLANNVAQIFLAGIFMFGSNVKFIASPMLCASFFTSLALGSFAENFCRKSVWFNELVLKSPVKIDSTFSEIEKVNFFYVFLSAIGFSVLTFRNSVFEIYFVVVLFVFLGFIKKRTLKIFPSVLLIFFIVFFSLFSPHGKILFSFGKLNITLGALNLGLAKAGRLCGFVFISQFVISKNIFFHGRVGKFFSNVMSYFSKLTETKIRLKKENFISQIDSRLCKVWQNEI